MKRGWKWFWGILGLLMLFYVIDNPSGAAGVFQQALSSLRGAAEAVIQFIGGLFS